MARRRTQHKDCLNMADHCNQWTVKTQVLIYIGYQMQNSNETNDSHSEYLKEYVHHMPRGHAFCVREFYESDWKHFSKLEKADIRNQFDEEFIFGDFASLLSLGFNDQGHEVFTKPFFDLHDLVAV